MKTRMWNVLALAAASGMAGLAQAQVLNPDFGACYDIRTIASLPGVPANYGGVTFKFDDPDVLLIGGAANGGSGAVYQIRVTRDVTGTINGVTGTATLFSTAPQIDGGLTYGPGNVLLFTGYSNNVIGQIKVGSVVPDQITSLSPLGVTSSTGTLQFVPDGYPGEGQLKVASYNGGTWHTLPYLVEANGLLSFGQASAAIGIGGGPEGIVFVQPGNPGFTTHSALVCEYGMNRVVAYDLDANGDPILATRRIFITGLSGAEGGTRDPRTGHFIFSTFGGGNKLVIVTGFNRGCPANFNGDCSVDDTDFVFFAQAYDLFSCSDPAMPAGCAADFNGDGFVDDFDFVVFAQAYDGFFCQ